MEQYHYIRTAYRVYGESIRKISRNTGHDRKTIRKALNQERTSYKERISQPYPVLGPYMEIIDSWLKSDKEVPKKQRHTAKRIFDRLVKEHGFIGGEMTVRHYVHEAKIKLGLNVLKAFVPLDPDCGQEAEVDWGTAQAVIDGQLSRLKFFCLRSKYSGKPFVRLYENERQQAFFDAHIHAFNFFWRRIP